MLEKIVEGKNLSFEEAYEIFNQLIEETPIRIAGILTALQTKGYTAEELAGFAKAMRDKAVKLDLGDVIDTCGTGGDRSFTINVSTASAIILSCFTRVAKHGNVSITSKSGSANLLEALGINYRLNPDQAKALIEKTNFTFLFAPLYHPTLKGVMPVRKELGIKTIFNVLGPLANPANPSYQIIGVSSPDLVDKVANALEFLGVERAYVVYGDGLDEVNPKGETVVVEVNEGIEKFKLEPEDFGLKPVDIKPCHSPEESAERIRAVLAGKGKEEDRNFVLINSALALNLLKDDLRECVEVIEGVLGEIAIKKLEEIVCSSRSLTT
ncbi:anthranilate phosphoribosyltransferase [Archaeoglobus profundus]|uniref:Anthranilate phosphoribosyltransferase n=1 Tax=Archaeoglobus profundus (strain DSM 5631 / JCM 9629 / NBRC 100127 / Av18) TaxID=572546 RepID=D2RG58_ARCPA|nr:anthranilate phosphoribosyltransferase [Archaeoglobus profundus]ADB57283.1 anthranilate phosphoribosyltransferase [Archaeoglobus profundus DSM 5631]